MIFLKLTKLTSLEHYNNILRFAAEKLLLPDIISLSLPLNYVSIWKKDLS